MPYRHPANTGAQKRHFMHKGSPKGAKMCSSERKSGYVLQIALEFSLYEM